MYPGGYGSVPMQPEAPNAMLIFLLGLFGVIFLQILSPVAWYLGAKSRREIKAQPPNTFRSEGLVTAGWILGIIGTILMILAIVFIILMFAFLLWISTATEDFAMAARTLPL